MVSKATEVTASLSDCSSFKLFPEFCHPLFRDSSCNVLCGLPDLGRLVKPSAP